MNRLVYHIIRAACVLALSTGIPVGVFGQFIDSSAERVKTPLVVNLKRIGTLIPRSTTAIASSSITVGCETLDRNHTNFDAYKAYLAPLGAKKIRLQAGWAKTEKVKTEGRPGVYDWQWLDEVIDYAVANQIEPWLETSYGNPIYEGGGGTNLLNSIPTSPEGYAAYDRWVEALVTRYKDRVHEWEIWNEPDHPMQKIEPETTAELNIRTADIIKRIQPDARIAGLAFASNSNTAYLDRFLKVISDRGKLGQFYWLSYHSYNFRPEDSYKGMASLRAVIDKYSKTLRLRQGENGAPSGYIPSFALDKYYWTEYTQAKYDLRRLLGDLGRGIETSVFTIIDIYYDWGKNAVLNTKGLIQSDTSKAAIRPKVAYYAVQNLASVFDDQLELVPNARPATNATGSVSVFQYQQKTGRKQIVTVWSDSTMPTNKFETTPIDMTVENGNFDTPVWVDLLTGHIYELPKNSWSKTGTTYTFRNIPVYDSPVLIAEKSLLQVNKSFAR